MKDIRKVIIPVAGWGTRSLPATKNIPKEMLPIYNKPVIQYVVEEAIRAKIRDVIFVTNRDKSVIEDHFDYNLQLEGVLERAGKLDKLQAIREVAEMVNIMSVRQKKQLGLGHAVLCARELVRGDPFAIMVGDDLMFGGVPGIGQLIEVAMAEKMPVVGVMEVPWEKVSKYGIIDGEEVAPGVFRVRDMVEKPKREDAPSRLAIVGRYVLTPDIFDYLEKVEPGQGGEIQLTDALQSMAKERGMMAVRMAGMRFDAGDWAEFLTANIYFALQDEELRYELLGLLKNFVQFVVPVFSSARPVRRFFGGWPAFPRRAAFSAQRGMPGHFPESIPVLSFVPMPYAHVALLSPPYATLTYSLPEYFGEELWRPGLRVAVPLGRGGEAALRAAVLLDVRADADVPPGVVCKAVFWPLETTPLLSPALLELMRDLALRQGVEPGHVLGHVLPQGLRSTGVRLRRLGGRAETWSLRGLRQAVRV